MLMREICTRCFSWKADCNCQGCLWQSGIVSSLVSLEGQLQLNCQIEGLPKRLKVQQTNSWINLQPQIILIILWHNCTGRSGLSADLKAGEIQRHTQRHFSSGLCYRPQSHAVSKKVFKMDEQRTQELRPELVRSCVSVKNSLGLSAARTSGTFWTLAPHTVRSRNSRGGFCVFEALRGIGRNHSWRPGGKKNITKINVNVWFKYRTLTVPRLSLFKVQTVTARCLPLSVFIRGYLPDIIYTLIWYFAWDIGTITNN